MIDTEATIYLSVNTIGRNQKLLRKVCRNFGDAGGQHLAAAAANWVVQLVSCNATHFAVAATNHCTALTSIYEHTISGHMRWDEVSDTNTIQDCLAVDSIARDDPSPLPGMHRDHNVLPSQTDGH